MAGGKGRTVSLVEISSMELDIFFQHFYTQVEKDGSNYEPESLCTESLGTINDSSIGPSCKRVGM